VARRTDRHVIVVPPEADLVTRLDPQLVSQLLWDDDLTLGPNTMSHTDEYNFCQRAAWAISRWATEPETRTAVGT